jgi:hypothetical protein
MITTITYLPDADYAAQSDAIAASTLICDRLNLEPCPFTGRVEAHQVMDLIGGMLNIWPESARATIEAA